MSVSLELSVTDVVYVLVWRILLLNFNLHDDESISMDSSTGKKTIEKSAFVSANSRIGNEGDLKSHVEEIYHSAFSEPIRFQTDEVKKCLLWAGRSGWLHKQVIWFTACQTNRI